MYRQVWNESSIGKSKNIWIKWCIERWWKDLTCKYVYGMRGMLENEKYIGKIMHKKEWWEEYKCLKKYKWNNTNW